MKTMRRIAAVCWLVLAGAPPAGFGQQIVDEGALAVLRNGTLIAHEEFSVRRGRGGASEHYTVSSTAYYPPARPVRTIAAAVSLGADSQPATAQFDVTDGARQTILMSLGARRTLVRVRSETGESAREFPGAARRLVTHDSVFALYAVLPGVSPGTVHLVSSTTASRSPARLSDRGMEVTGVGATSRPLRHFTLDGADGARHVWLDEDGRLMKVEIPARGLVAVRVVAAHR